MPSLSITPSRVSIIIPHWRGKEILVRCLESLASAELTEAEIILVDNGSTDGSVDGAQDRFPGLRLLRSERNLGYAGGCNIGLKEASGRYALLLNDDALVTPGFLRPLIEAMETGSGIGACQPKILSIANPRQFDYAGASGGYMDVLGFPFCRGRIFDTVEPDNGQYDDAREIFWASGACCLLRMDALRRVGFFDEDFFAHMEEIDLQWRMRLAGYRIIVVPQSVVRHDAGSTLQQDTPRKVFLNHRNNLTMMAKNLTNRKLLVVVPLRMFFEVGAILLRLLSFQPGNAWAIVRAVASFLAGLPGVLKRKNVSAVPRVLSDHDVIGALYRRSVVIDYYLLRRRSFSRLPASAMPGIPHGT
jgi:hypothetical protein